MARNPYGERCLVSLAVLALLGGCTSGSSAAPAVSPTRSDAPTPTMGETSPGRTPAITITFQEFHDSFCSAWESMFRAIGNPDTGSGSELTAAMDAAITAGDLPSVDRVAAQISGELESGRRQVERATGWPPATPMMAQLDLVFVGFEALTEAKRAAANQGLQVARTRGQQALVDAGAIDAWFALIRPGVLDETRRAMESATPPGAPAQCANVPVGF